MIIKRLAKALKQQDWLAVSIEIIIVVLGVVLGFQVTDWGESREQRIQEYELLSRLRIEFENNRALYDKVADEHRLSIQKASQMLAFTGPKPSGYNELQVDSLLFYLISETPAYHPAAGEYQAMLASGQLALVRNDSIRIALAAWPGILERMRDTEKEMKSDVVTLFFPYVLQRIPLVTVDSQVGYIDMPPSRFERNYDTVLSDVQFENHVENRWVMARYILDAGSVVERHLDEIIRLIDAEIARSS